MRKSTTGFTIVELLIVIVVIAILATISIVAYQGIQDRAEASKTVSAVQAYKKALQLYKVDKDSYPTVAFCLGDQYDSFTSGGGASCRHSAAPVSVTVGAAGRDELKPYLGGQLPMPSKKFLHLGSTEFAGGLYYSLVGYNYTLDGVPAVAIEYYIKGNSCPVGPVYTLSSGTAFVSPEVSRTSALTDGSRCYILLPNS